MSTSISTPTYDAESVAPAMNGCENIRGRVYALDFSPWKKPIVQRFLQNAEIHFIKTADGLPGGSTLIVWGTRSIVGSLPPDTQIVRLEDGFIRSVGLGADLVTPLSWVADRRGIYYDASCESDLEHLLATQVFDAALLASAARLRQSIVEAGITKYNLDGADWQRPAAQRVILVPGQVEDDASIRYGAPHIRSNLALLEAVRAANPQAYIVYKPHPDVLAGLRKQGQSEALARQYCDAQVTHTPMHRLLDAVDEVHLMTSLTGFEALLRGVQVTCYGQPFYAGWGLTTDMLPIARRKRALTLDQLVAGALLLYPTYVSRNGHYGSAQQALEELLEWRQQSGHAHSGLWLRARRKLLGVAAGLRSRRSR